MSSADVHGPRVILVTVKVLLRALVFLWLAGAVSPGQSPLMGIASEELERNFRILKEKTDPPPYFLAYEITETRSSQIAALRRYHPSGGGKQCCWPCSVCIGLQADTTAKPAGARPFTSGVSIALDDSPAAIQRRMWLETDRAPRRCRTAHQDSHQHAGDVAAEDPRTIFPRAAVSAFGCRQPCASTPPTGPSACASYPWLKAHTAILTSSVSVAAQRESRYFVNTEGARVEHGRGFARVVVAHGRAADGMNLTTAATDALDAASLPADEVPLARSNKWPKIWKGCLKRRW